MQKITPNLWFDDNAEEAVDFYVSIFKNSKITRVLRNTESSRGVTDQVVTIEFQLEGQRFVAINGGSNFKFTPAVSLAVDCKDQAEVDDLWDKLTQGGQEQQCGWLLDKYGLSWQVIPTGLVDLLSGPDEQAADRAVQCMLGMVKLDIAEIRRAYEGD